MLPDTDVINLHGGRCHDRAGAAASGAVVDDQVHRRAGNAGTQGTNQRTIIVELDDTALPVSSEGMPTGIVAAWTAAIAGRIAVEMVLGRSAQSLDDVHFAIVRPNRLTVRPPGRPVGNRAARGRQVNPGFECAEGKLVQGSAPIRAVRLDYTGAIRIVYAIDRDWAADERKIEIAAGNAYPGRVVSGALTCIDWRSNIRKGCTKPVGFPISRIQRRAVELVTKDQIPRAWNAYRRRVTGGCIGRRGAAARPGNGEVITVIIP